LYNENSTINDEILDDVNDAIKELGENKSYKFDKISILGHSLGAMLGPKIAYDNKEVSGFISLAGSPRKLEDIISIKSTSKEKYFDLSAVYWNSLNNIKYEELVNSIDIPVLILHGTEDKQVFADNDYKLLKEVYANKKATFKLYDGLNHLFMKDKEENVDNQVINDITNWILDIR